MSRIAISAHIEVNSSNNKVYGTRMHGFKRSHNQAVFRYYGDDGLSDTADDKLVFKSFDNYGRNVGSFTTDNTECKILGVSAAAYTENSGTSKQNNRLLGSLSSGYQGIDLLKNGGGEKGTADWTGGVSTSAYVLYGAKAFKVASSTLSQQVSISASGTYTFSAYVKVPNNGSAYLKVAKGSNINESEIVDYSTAGVNGGWTRLTLTFPANSSGTYTCSLVTTGTVYADALQLEQEQAASTYNLLEDGTFEATGTSLTATTDAADWDINPGVWQRIGTAGFATNTDSYFGGKALSLTGDANRHHVIQRVDMDCEAGSTFLVSAWAKATADPESMQEKEDTESPYFGIFVRLLYADETEEVQFFSFDPLYDGWQLRQGIVAPKEASANKAITDILVALAYDSNYNTALFDNVSLRLEPSQTYYYDEDGNLKTAAQVGTGTEEAEYDENGIDLKKYTAANGTTFNYTYNSAHDVTSAVSDGVTAAYEYDDAGNMIKTTLTGGALTMESSAAMTGDHNHTASVTDAAGNTTRYEYDNHRELLTKVTDAKNGVTEYEYDEKNDRPTKTTQKNSAGTVLASVSYTYSGGRLSRLTRTSGSKTQYYNFAYNLWGQSTSVKVGSYTLASYTYEDLAGNSTGSGGGNLKKMTYGNGDYVSYTYDEFDRLVEMVYNDTGEYVLYGYNAEGSLAKITHGGDSFEDIVYTFEYDSLGRLIRSQQGDCDGLFQRTEHIYDAYGRLSSQAWVIGATAFSESYSYDDPTGTDSSGDGSLKQMTTATGATIDYAYDELKRLDTTTVKLPGSSSALYTTDYGYIAKSGKATPLVGIHAVQVGSTAVIDYRYTYDNLGNITAIYEGSSPGRILFSYTYDSQNQLLSETHYTYSGTSTTATTNVYSYTYDTAGNILTEKKNGTTTKTYTYGNSSWKDLLTGFNGTTISYDGAGNPTSYTNGKADYRFEWVKGRSLQYAAIMGDEQLQAFYEYDADGIRNFKDVDGMAHNYITQNGKVVRETIGSGSTAKILDFIYDESGKPFALKYSTNGGSSFGTYYYVLNLQGDVVKLVNTSGTVVANYTYNAWGEVLTATGNMAAINPLRYRGYYYDTETGFYYLQSRYYDPATHRFLNADCAPSTGQGIIGTNMFAYCNNNPVCSYDSTGREPVEILDTDGNCKGDCYVYTYTYTKGKLFPEEKTGKVYIYTNLSNREELLAMEKPEGFNSSTDIMVACFAGEDTKNPVMFASNAHKVDKKHRANIIKCLLKFDEECDTAWDRTEASLLIEWEGHHKWRLASSAKHIDFDNNEEGKSLEYYDEKAYSRIEDFFNKIFGRN